MEARNRGKTWNEFEIGEATASAGRTITETDTVMFGCLTGDMNPLHTNEVFASNSPYGRRIVHGAYGQALMVGQAAQLGIFEGTTIALRQMDTRFRNPIFFGDTVHVVMRVEGKKDLKGMDQGLIIFKAQLFNQDQQIVINSTWTVLMKKN